MRIKLFILLGVFFAKDDLFAQVAIGKAVKIDRLIKREMKFYHEDSSSVLYNGEAFSFFPGTKTVEFYWKIDHGVTLRFYRYSQVGKLITEESFNATGMYSGKYFQGNEKGDTLNFGQYKNGKKIGNWITIDNSDARKTVRY